MFRAMRAVISSHSLNFVASYSITGCSVRGHRVRATTTLKRTITTTPPNLCPSLNADVLRNNNSEGREEEEVTEEETTAGRDVNIVSADDYSSLDQPREQTEHAVISAFDLFSIGVGPSSSHTVGPMRAGRIFINDLIELDLLEKVKMVKITLYGSLAATGKGHHTPQAILLGLEGSDPETIDTGTIPSRYAAILENQSLMLNGHHHIHYDMDRDMLWRWDQVLKTHPNGMRFSVFGESGELLATNEYFSVGGGFVVNEKTKVDENLFYKGVDKSSVHGARLSQTHSLSDPADSSSANRVQTEEDPAPPPYPFTSGDSLLALTKKHNMTIAQIVYDNELHFGYSDDEIGQKLMRIWAVMDDCIRTGVSSAEDKLPGRLGLRRRAPMLYRRLMRGFYTGVAAGSQVPLITASTSSSSHAIDAPEFDEHIPQAEFGRHPRGSETPTEEGLENRRSGLRSPRVVGSFKHPILPMPPRRTMIPAMDFLSCYAIAVNEVNASGGRIVTSPTNGAAGIIPAVLKYVVEFVTDDPDKAIETFLLTAAAVGMLFKRGSTISAAEGGCQAEVGVACSMASAGFAACMGADPETVLQAAEIGIEHNLGLTCDPIDGLVQVPCIERNSLGAVKAVTAAQLSMASQNVYSVTLDEAIEAMRLTAADMSVKYKETSLSGLARTVKIPLTVPAC
ncbi:serine dehydratase alpha chain-domain-containing protein [Irpex rosettiformis]|uniref:Serine dehydratase alpha chain-domain-containing protein n=1 Tax=Irpex rosettiformis TaxID=378272 RepID=A0ACB8UC19_9APHY|nr:serine dehydratase alpha chain-domain-containing protein [Irpex rosettiformis]